MQELAPSINLPTIWGAFTVHSIVDELTTHLLLSYGNIDISSPVLVRVHSSCCFGDVFGGLSCDCRAQLERSIEIITSEGGGLIFYLNQEGRGLGLAAKIQAIRIEQTDGVDTVEAFSHLHYPLDQRRYHAVSNTLSALGIRSIRLLTNNPDKCESLTRAGIYIIREPLITNVTIHSAGYIKAKVEKMGHLWEPIK